MAGFVTNEGAESLLDGSIDWASHTIKARLVASSFTPTRDDTVMTGYTAIGTDQTLTSKTRTKDTTNDRIVYDAADVVFPTVALGSTIGTIAIYRFVTADSDSVPIAILDVTNSATTGGNVTLPFAATGIFYLQQ